MDAMGGDLNKKSMHVTEPRMGLGNLRSDTFTFSQLSFFNLNTCHQVLDGITKPGL